MKILDDRKKAIENVRKGYKSNEIFSHTMQDISKVLKHKLRKQNPSVVDSDGES